MAVAERLESDHDLQSRWDKRRREWAEKVRPRTLPIEDPEKTLHRRIRWLMVFMGCVIFVFISFLWDRFVLQGVFGKTLIPEVIRTIPFFLIWTLYLAWKGYASTRRMLRDYLEEKTAFEAEERRCAV